MKIIVNNYKNIINFEVVIIDQQFNIIYGLSGSGKSAISEVFNEPSEKTNHYSVMEIFMGVLIR